MDAGRESAGARDDGRMSVAGELLAVLRLAVTFRLDATGLTGRDGSIALLGVAALTAWALPDWLRHAEALELQPAAFTLLAACAAVALALAWLIARLNSPPLPFRRSLWLVAGYLPIAAAALWLLRAPITRLQAMVLATALIAHALLYFFFGLRALSGRPWRGLAAGAAGVALIGALQAFMPAQASLWSIRRSPEVVAHFVESQRRTESLLYAQPDRIDAALAAMAPREAGAPNAFFLGFAGFGDQTVFAQEIALAAQRMDEIFGTGPRQLLLVNDRRDYDRHPLASRSALARALRGIAARMDRENDVLFLAVSSHGKRDPHLVVSHGSLPLETLTPEALAALLDESGIRWKVLVISACYSGAFVDALRDEYTAVITAAAPDRASFGCNDRRQLTYFGEAFYRDALPKAPQLRAAFEAATADLAGREQAQGLKPSLPQAHFGAHIERKLDELRAQRQGGAGVS